MQTSTYIQGLKRKIEDAEYRLSCMEKDVDEGAFEEIYFEIDELYGKLIEAKHG